MTLQALQMQSNGNEWQGGMPGFLQHLGNAPLLIAHRGYRACYPENTRCAFAASADRTELIELDVQLSADEEAVVFHDALLGRTSNAARIAPGLGLTSLALADWRLDQLRRLDLGSWFLDADPFGTIAGGMVERAHLLALMPQQIMTLGEVLGWAGSQGLALNIELKDQGQTRRNELLAAVAVREIRRAGAVHRVLVSSFNHLILRACRHLAPELATAALQAHAHPPDLLAYLQVLGVMAYHPENVLVTPELVATLRSAGLLINVFTINEPARQRELFAWGVHGVFTDYPHRPGEHRSPAS